MLPRLRFRWIALTLTLAVLIALRPTPTATPLVAPVVAAAQALSNDQPEAAAALFEAAISFVPSNASLHLHTAQSYLLAGDPDRAMDYLQAAEERSANDAALESLRGEALLALGDLQGATSSWESAELAAPLPEEIIRNLARSYMDLGLTAEAYTAFSNLANLLPHDLDALLHLGVLAAGAAPSDADEFLRLAEQHVLAGHPLIRDLRSSIEAGLEYESPAYRLSVVGKTLMLHGEWELAEYVFRGALEYDPDYVDARAYHGLALLKIGEDGLPELLAALETDSNAMLPHVLLGMYYLDSGEAGEALHLLEAAVELNSTNPAILAQLGAALDAAGEVDQAVQAYRSAAEMVPDNADFWLLLAQYTLSREIEVVTVALPAARNAVALRPRNAGGLDALGYGHYLLGNYPMSERLLDRSVRLDPSLALTQYHLGLLRLAQGDVVRARAALDLAVLLDPDGAVGTMAQLTLGYINP